MPGPVHYGAQGCPGHPRPFRPAPFNGFVIMTSSLKNARTIADRPLKRQKDRDKAILGLADTISLQRATLDEIARIASSPEEFFVKTKPSEIKKESPMTHPTDGTPGQEAVSLEPKDIAKVTYRNRAGAPEKPPWPTNPTGEKLPPLTAPLVDQYVTRIRLMEKALELAYRPLHAALPGDMADVVRCLWGSYRAILRALLEETGLGIDRKEQS